MADKTEREVELEQAVAALQSGHLKDQGLAIVPDGWRIEDVQQYTDRPRRISADHTFVTVESLVTYLLRFADDDTMIKANYAEAMIFATIDGDACSAGSFPALPSFKTHHARFKAVMGDQIKAWLAICKKPMKQVTFGQFLENRARDVVRPDAADVMEMVMKFEATKKVEFKSQTRLANGDRQFQYTEETNAARGGITLPDHFIVRAPIYRGQEPQDIKFWVRYSIDDGTLLFTVEMHEQDEVFRQAFERCVDAMLVGISAADLDLSVYIVG